MPTRPHIHLSNLCQIMSSSLSQVSSKQEPDVPDDQSNTRELFAIGMLNFYRLIYCSNCHSTSTIRRRLGENGSSCAPYNYHDVFPGVLGKLDSLTLIRSYLIGIRGNL